MKWVKGLFFILSVLVWDLALAQSSKSHKLFQEARSLYRAGEVKKAIGACEKIIEKDDSYANAYLLLSEIYKDMDSTRLEIKYLTMALGKVNNPLIDFRLGEAFYKLGMYSEALSFYEKYKENKNIPEKRQFLLACKIASCKFAINSIKNPVSFEPKNLGEGVNTPDDEYWPTPSLDGKHLVFTRLRKNTGRAQEDFYMSVLDSFNWDYAQPLNEVNTADNEGAQTLSADAKIIFFTACNRPDAQGSCDIYFSRFVNGKWTEPRNAGLPLNTPSWEGQPSLSSDSKFLYFSSNRPGGVGGKDIWRIPFNGFDEAGNPSWGEPQNLKALNTVGNEISPFIHANNQNFYFASDTHVGMGGFDLFSAIIEKDGTIRDLKNMGYPINTNKDDMGLTISSIGDVAYFSSARESDNGLDIFSFNLDRGLQPRPVSYVKAKVYNKVTGQPVSASIELVNLSSPNRDVQHQQADENGEVMMALPLRRNYAFNVSEEGFMFYSQSMQLAQQNSLTEPFILDIALTPIEVGAQMDLYNIYFETDSFRILAESEPELQKLVAFLKDNRNLRVEIQGHTDSSGDPEHNRVLSEKRAFSVLEYLAENGVKRNRMVAKGYGDTRPVADNSTPEGRRLNRRTTIEVLQK